MAKDDAKSERMLLMIVVPAIIVSGILIIAAIYMMKPSNTYAAEIEACKAAVRFDAGLPPKYAAEIDLINPGSVMTVQITYSVPGRRGGVSWCVFKPRILLENRDGNPELLSFTGARGLADRDTLALIQSVVNLDVAIRR